MAMSESEHSSARKSDQEQPFRLDGRHALVTGGASGIGEATVKELVRAGAFVWIADINLAAAEKLAASSGENWSELPLERKDRYFDLAKETTQ